MPGEPEVAVFADASASDYLGVGSWAYLIPALVTIAHKIRNIGWAMKTPPRVAKPRLVRAYPRYGKHWK